MNHCIYDIRPDSVEKAIPLKQGLKQFLTRLATLSISCRKGNSIKTRIETDSL